MLVSIQVVSGCSI